MQRATNLDCALSPRCRGRAFGSSGLVCGRSEIAARAFATEFAWAVREICNAPERWKRADYATRRFMLPNFPFSIVYRVQQDAVEVVAVAHHRRRPGYWRGR
ncbi:MAG: type II toxin-antitoxin system RelE/ParE family toxin [Pseudomonadota bacterium]|nr:type II toxin-antitoxin system RelE/ParE family toxin [Pseudomonadota bacterium]